MEHAQKKLEQQRTDKNSHSMDVLNQRDLPTVQCIISAYTEAVHYHESSWGRPSLSLTTKGCWLHHEGWVAKPPISPLDASTHIQW